MTREAQDERKELEESDLAPGVIDVNDRLG
jgi:hypothetical protein